MMHSSTSFQPVSDEHPIADRRRSRILAALFSVAVLLVSVWQPVPAATVPFDIVYVRAPRFGDDKFIKWADVYGPMQLEPGSDLMLLHPDGTEEVLVPGGKGAL